MSYNKAILSLIDVEKYTVRFKSSEISEISHFHHSVRGNINQKHYSKPLTLNFLSDKVFSDNAVLAHVESH